MIKNDIVAKLGLEKRYYINGHDWAYDTKVIIVLEFNFEYK